MRHKNNDNCFDEGMMRNGQGLDQDLYRISVMWYTVSQRQMDITK